MKKKIFIDFLGYYPFGSYLICEKEDEWIESLPLSKGQDKLKERIRNKGWEVICNPRFRDFPNHIKLINYLNK